MGDDVRTKDDVRYERCTESAYGDPHHWVTRVDGYLFVEGVREPRYVQQCAECGGRLRTVGGELVLVPQHDRL